MRVTSLIHVFEDARIRAFFVHPTYARRGLGSLLLEQCERVAREQGFTQFEIGATRR